MSMFAALGPRAPKDIDPFQANDAYLAALEEIKVDSFLPEGIRWGDIGPQFDNGMMNILPPVLPEKQSFVRRPRSLTEQSDLSELSAEDVADRTASGTNVHPEEAKPQVKEAPKLSKEEQRQKEMDELEAMLSEFGGNSREKNGQDSGPTSTEKETVAAGVDASAVAAFLGGDVDGGNDKKKKKKKGKKKGGGGAAASSGAAASNSAPQGTVDVKAVIAAKAAAKKKTTSTSDAAKIAAAETAARKAAMSKKRGKKK